MYQHPHFYHVTNEYFLLKKCIFHDFGIMDLRTTEPFRSDSRTFFSNLRTFGLKNLRTHEPSNLRTFGLIGCNRFISSVRFICNLCNNKCLCSQNHQELSSQKCRIGNRFDFCNRGSYKKLIFKEIGLITFMLFFKDIKTLFGMKQHISRPFPLSTHPGIYNNCEAAAYQLSVQCKLSCPIIELVVWYFL